MAADEVGEDKEAIIAAVERTFQRMVRDMDVSVGPQSAPSDFAVPPDAHTFTAAAFTTGYDTGTGETTMPFVLDFSILYGDGVSGDILTGS